MAVTVRSAEPMFWTWTPWAAEPLTATVPKLRDAGLRLMSGTAAAVTLKELVETISWPWFALPGSGVQREPKTVLPPTSPRSYWLPYHATFQVYVPPAAGAGAFRVIG